MHVRRKVRVVGSSSTCTWGERVGQGEVEGNMHVKRKGGKEGGGGVTKRVTCTWGEGWDRGRRVAGSLKGRHAHGCCWALL